MCHYSDESMDPYSDVFYSMESSRNSSVITPPTLTCHTHTTHFLSDGVHVGQSDMSAAEVRRLLGPNMILGVSTKSCAEVRQPQSHVLIRLLCLSEPTDCLFDAT
jgi:Thiamine monophosphate synthase